MSTSTVQTKKSWVPTKKWIVAQVTALGGLAIMLLTGDSEVTDPEIIAVVTFFVQAIATYLVPNADTAGGVPRKAV